MAERARFEIFPIQHHLNNEGTGPTGPGRYQWWFRIDGDIVCRSVRSFVSSDAASDDIHPDIIDLDAENNEAS